MATTQSPKAPRLRQARKSIAHLPAPDFGEDKENATVDTATIQSLTANTKQAVKKSRSKSIGPGGLDALKESAGNKRDIGLPQVKSILKPTVAHSPPKAIPPRNIDIANSQSHDSGYNMIEKTAGRSPKSPSSKFPDQTTSKPETSSNPFRSSPKAAASAPSPSRSPELVALRTKEEQEAAAEERKRQEKVALKDARRKSLANRRVSFAPEATLHTWNVVEVPEDSTTSSASTNSTRRASGLTANAGSPYRDQRSPMPSSDASEPPSTPPEQMEEVQVAASPAHQRDLHQKKRRRSSGIPPMNFNDPNEFSSSPCSGVSEEDTGTQAFETADEGSSSSDSDDKDLVEDETITGVDDDGHSVHSAEDNNTTGSSDRLEAALRQAATQAGTQGIDYDENGDNTMEMADEEITNAFKPWMKKGQYVAGDPSALQDQENLNPFSPAFKANIRKIAAQGGGDTMEMTQAVGRVLSASEDSQASPKRRRRKSITGNNRRRSSTARRRSSGDGSSLGGDETMDLTMAVGSIQPDHQERDCESADDDEELTMEFTSVVGGVVQPTTVGLGASQLSNDPNASRRESIESSQLEEDMDFTHAAGGILLPSITERTEPPEDQTMDMDVTTALGTILPEQLSTGNKAQAKAMMELETDVGQLSASSFHNGSPQKPNGAGVFDERPLPTHMHATTIASGSGSPSLVATETRSGAKKNNMAKSLLTPKSLRSSPNRKPNTPSKQLTPQPMRPTTPGKTPPSKNVTMRTSSPKKLFKTEISAEKKKSKDATPKPDFANPLFSKNAATGAMTPSIVLKPRRRRSSGLGIDKEGLGSPSIAAVLDRRASIGDSAKAYVPQSQFPNGVRFNDAQTMEQEIDQERVEDERKESGRGILQEEADSQDLEAKDATTQLKDMIGSLTPQKKRKLNGRKSLHVGTAKGLLGKRPAESDDEDGEDVTLQKLEGRGSSPVKKARLPGPHAITSRNGRITRSTRLSLAETAGNARISTPSGVVSPTKNDTTPKDQARFKDAEIKSPVKVTSFDRKLERTTDTADTTEEEPIHLQQFLNMTSIKFMDHLATTKRRHTVLPNVLLEQSAKKAHAEMNPEEADISELESCVVAGACTLPLLEIYQHACRELKSYISEGRRLVKDIEVEAYEDQPPLFREYMSAPPDVKQIMDNQFKSVKTNARLLNKAGWYEWRMKLLDGLKDGLVANGQSMEEDDRSLTQQEQILQPVLPDLIKVHDELEHQLQVAQDQADEFADCDQEELKEARESLFAIERDLESKQHLIENLQNQLREKENALEDAVERKQQCIGDTKEAEKIRQDCRGWSQAEVANLQAEVTSLEEVYGWMITSTSGPALTMVFDRTLQLFFTPSSFMPNTSRTGANAREDAPISLTYIADAREHHPQALTTDKRFFLQIIRAQLQCLQQSQIKAQDLLSFVSSSWQSARAIVEEARVLGVSYIIEPTITADETMSIRSTILLRSMETKVHIDFEVKVRSGEGVSGLKVSVKPTAKVCYGENLKTKNMSDFLDTQIKSGKGQGVWAKAVSELEKLLIARGKK